MSDITMCANTRCTLRGKCYRYLAVPSDFWQSYCNYTPVKEGSKVTCDHLWETKWRQCLPLDDVDMHNGAKK
ncbi:MAG: hypothetical protein EOO40_00435 [Deltaproteobacteria bacterium]|nr:MAG: hypothetical protein EOO40_00435 [Deltaproteobacteria bacterium]